MPRTSIHVIKDVFRELKSLDIEEEVQIKDLASAIQLYGGAKPDVVHRYVKLLQDMQYIKKVGTGVFKLLPKAKELMEEV